MAGPQDCQQQACDIQSCLQRFSYDQAKCQKYVEALYKCCDEMFTRAEKEGRQIGEGSTACPIKEVVRRRVKGMTG